MQKVKTSLESPGAGESSRIFFDWKEPVDGGKGAAYKVQCCEPPESSGNSVALAMESKITLTNQGPGKEGEYRVISFNKAGEGQPSNTVMACLKETQQPMPKTGEIASSPFWAVEVTGEAWDKLMDTHLTALFLCGHGVGKVMTEQPAIFF